MPGSAIPRAYTITPVVAIGEASARPANYRRVQTFRLSTERFPNTADIWNFRILSNPDAIVDTTSEVLCEVAVNVRRNCANGFVGKNVDGCGGGKGSTGRKKSES